MTYPFIPPAGPSAPQSVCFRSEGTLAASFEKHGSSLHTGRHANVRLSPAAAGTGVVFQRRLRSGRVVAVPARWQARVSQPLCTALQAPDGTLVRTVEHLLAALSALAIDNALVEIDAEELPIFDGSATPWCEAIRDAGRVDLDVPRTMIKVLRSVEVRDGRRSLRIEPAERLSIAAHLALAHFGEMRWEGVITPESFVRDLAPSRSFGRLKWALPAKLYTYLTRRPVLRGANLSTTAGIVGGRIIGGMRVPEEPVRHRVLDLVGDLSLAGHSILGRVTAAHTGHELNHALVAKLMRDPFAWEIVGATAA
ncbi:UDP-3-O-acyl-N-acetylglucosamine deacetylase [Methylobacterium planeticum]|uniref:UDP-3-O-acyl-N-acetylglucosamine deacetylase n=1 Tax=Methylobacterium planeticum TaxID=2615211 RepID=A0A6N6MLZ2_9HYPH|nr:UDP-3-O-acyl-N-acetylglucosamine deacetylase [Methylobacterium planeticum]KAB1072308.1 UDP-3-O-acyl-N-acetylglucosamine deacetylase [Methylobacterium planeticum]